MNTHEKPPYMFSSSSVDYFFRWRWWAAWIFFIPITLGFFAGALYTATNYWQMLLAFVGGVLLWTLFEYVSHRYAFHYEGESTAMKHLHYIVHGMHHAYPTDPLRVIFPPFAAVSVGLVVMALLFVVMPVPCALSAMAGFILGYVLYEYMHYAAHHVKSKQSWFYRRKRHHLLHHHNEDYHNTNFGVTTEVWDRVFGSYKRH